MRIAVVLAVTFLAACASDRLKLTPPADVNFTGHWKLNEADSDDPMRLMLNQNAAAAGGPGTQGNPGGSGGRGGRQGGRGGGMAGMGGGPLGPATPSVGALAAGLRWPGKEVEIKQVAGVVAFTSGGKNRLCQPTDAQAKSRHRTASADSGAARDLPSMGRDTPPPICGWEEKTLIIRGGDPDDDHPAFEERYSISEDGQRLVEVVDFKGGRSNGYTMSRVWDRVGQ